MNVREITGQIYKINLLYGGPIYVEIPHNTIGKQAEGVMIDHVAELAKYCAGIKQPISSVTAINIDGSTPRVAVLSSKEYKAAVKAVTNKN